MYGYGYRYNSGLVVSAGGGAPFSNNSSILFDGVDDYVDVGVISTFQSTANFSISCWLKVPSLGANNFFIGTYLNASNTIYGYITASGEIVFNINNVYQRLSGTTAVNKIAVGLWYNITFVFDGSLGYPNGMLIYLNGVATTGTGVSNPLPTVTSANGGLTFIGGLNAGGLRFNGTMDEVSFYDYSLSSAEALAIGGTIPTDLSLLSTPPTNWYRNGDGVTAFPTIPDVIGSNNGVAYNENEATMIVSDVPL